MKAYEVFLSYRAKKDLKDIKAHISQKFNSPLAAAEIELSILEAIRSLNQFPYRTPVDPRAVISNTGRSAHKLVNGNFLIFYDIEEEKQEVYILKIRHHLQDSVPLLRYKNGE